MAGSIVNPYEEVLRLKRSVDKLFESMGTETEGSDVRMPVVDLIDEKNEILLVVELPGLKKDDIKIAVVDNAVTIRADKSAENEEKKKEYYYSERQYSSFFRTLPLPEEVDPNSVKAKYKDGVLEVRFKKNENKKREIKEVKVE